MVSTAVHHYVRQNIYARNNRKLYGVLLLIITILSSSNHPFLQNAFALQQRQLTTTTRLRSSSSMAFRTTVTTKKMTTARMIRPMSVRDSSLALVSGDVLKGKMVHLSRRCQSGLPTMTMEMCGNNNGYSRNSIGLKYQIICATSISFRSGMISALSVPPSSLSMLSRKLIFPGYRSYDNNGMRSSTVRKMTSSFQTDSKNSTDGGGDDGEEYKSTELQGEQQKNLVYATDNQNLNNKSKMSRLTESLLGMTISRATRTISGDPDIGGESNDSTSGGFDRYAGRNMDNEKNAALNFQLSDGLPGDEEEEEEGRRDGRMTTIIDAAYTRATLTLDTTTTDDDNNNGTERRQQEDTARNQPSRDVGVNYLSNPTITPTALAHSLWKTVVRPYDDIVIDATCGNGKDAVALSAMLFPVEEDVDTDAPSKAQLICIDIQKRACRNTISSLQTVLPSTIYSKHVWVLHTSHAPLPQTLTSGTVGLVCYNLGYLPSSSSSTTTTEPLTTQMETTLQSLTDATLLLRPGGLLSVLTYPATSGQEAAAVRYFCEGLAMSTTRDEGGWRRWLDEATIEIAGEDGNGDGDREMTVKTVIREALERVEREGGGSNGKAWRVFDHRPLGRPLSPILVTASRIK